MKIPNADKAVVDFQKLVEYCLSSEHPRGKHKAKVFESALGITQANAEILRDTILKAVREHEATVGEQDNYGQRFSVDFEMITQAGKAVIRTGWIIRLDEDIPRLTTCYVL
ncbi:MAG: hypothetical protein U0670_02835 [Anaerolineae bacterium]